MILKKIFTIDKSQQRHNFKIPYFSESNQRLLGEKNECYLCANSDPVYYIAA